MLVKDRLFEVAKGAYERFDSAIMHRLHPDYRRAWIRFMVGLKNRFFPGAGRAALERWLDGDVQSRYELAAPLKRSVAEVLRPVDGVVRPESWIWIENENLLSISRYYGRNMSDLNSFGLSEPCFVRSSSEPLLNVLDSLRRKNIVRVFLLPWLRHGGADRLAIAYIRAAVERYPHQVLVIITEPGRSPRVNELPNGCELLFWSDVVGSCSIASSAQNLAWLLCEIGASSVHIINSHVGWEMLRISGQKVRALMNIWVSLFWYGPSPKDRLRGYAAEYLWHVVESIDGIITDNRTFPLRLAEDYGIDSKKIYCVYNPVFMDMNEETSTRDSKFRGRILWASRFSPEKRLDILCDIALKCDKYTFVIFGSSDGSDPVVEHQLAALAKLKNVDLNGEFQKFSELPFRDCDLFLYTSSSDGLPNILLEAMAAGLPVVAPAVGGVGELIDENTGWLIGRSDDVEAYVRAINDAMENGDQRDERARAGRHLVLERHSAQRFVESVSMLPGYF